MAKANPNSPQYYDGPSLNKRIASMVSNGQVDLISSTFSDHILNYFGNDFNANNVSLANKFLQGIYGALPSPNVFWLPEQAANDSVLAKVQSLDLATPSSTRPSICSTGLAGRHRWTMTLTGSTRSTG